MIYLLLFLGISKFCFCSTTIMVGTITTIIFFAILCLTQYYHKKRLLLIDKSKKEMVANITHDLRTPIAVIQGYTETVLMKMDTLQNKEKENFLNIILENSDRLSILITQMFEYSKLDSQQIKLQKEPFSIKEMLENIIEEYQVLAARKAIQLSIVCPSEKSIVYADVLLIQRVIQNLLDNALTYTPKGGNVSIAISNQQDKVRVEVIDSGPGIDKPQQALIFDRYQKNTTSRGIGLGLNIVKKILELHHSAIQVNSKLGQGTKFVFSLPIYYGTDHA